MTISVMTISVAAPFAVVTDINFPSLTAGQLNSESSYKLGAIVCEIVIKFVRF